MGGRVAAGCCAVVHGMLGVQGGCRLAWSRQLGRGASEHITWSGRRWQEHCAACQPIPQTSTCTPSKTCSAQPLTL